jgi:succinate dehydrogenase hydrophobic anchor subunit
MLVLIAIARPTVVSLLVSAAVMFVGWFINIVTYGILQKKQKLITSGPYAFVRNPFYVGTFFADVGMSIAANPFDLIVLLICVLYFFLQVVFYGLQIKREERDLLALFGEEYSAYCRRVPRIVPSIRSGLRNGGFHFEWSFDVALFNRVFSRATGAYLWLCFIWGVFLVSPKGGCFLSGSLQFNRLLSDRLFLPIFVAAVCVYGMFKVVEDVHKNEEKRKAKGIQFS